MAILSKEEFIEKLKVRLGDDLTDEDIALVEDFSDSYDAVYDPDREDWREKYEENDRSWRERYMQRFSGGGDSDILEIEKASAESYDIDDGEDYVSPKTYDELFEEV